MRNKIVIGAVVFIIGLVAFSAAYLIEEYEAQVWVGASKEAKLNPFLGAQRFLETRGVRVVSTNETLDFKTLSVGETVFLSKVDSMLVSPSQVDAALDWINRGGYMVVGVGAEVEGQVSILKHFNIEPFKRKIDIDEIFTNKDGEPMTASQRMREINRQIEENKEKESQAADNESKQENAESSAEGEPLKPTEIDADDDFNQQLFDLLNVEYDHEFYRVKLGEDYGEMHLAVLDRISLDQDELFSGQTGHGLDFETVGRVRDEHGGRLVQISYGDGTFTALSSAELWENDYIGLADHAYFLSYLVPDNSDLHLLYNVSAPSLSSILYRYFYEFIWAGMALLILWLWNRGIRVQRVTETQEGQRRNFSEHLVSGAEFLIKNKQYQELIQPIKEDIEQQMRPFYPNFPQLNEHSQAAMLHERTNVSQAIINDWLRYCQKVENNSELFAALKIGNAIRKTL